WKSTNSHPASSPCIPHFVLDEEEAETFVSWALSHRKPIFCHTHLLILLHYCIAIAIAILTLYSFPLRCPFTPPTKHHLQ
ncbi:hypothetical protein Tsubulata_042686, partial [Turnera subulata]